jgi:hypothetical protein
MNPNNILRLPKILRGLRCQPRETQAFTWAYGNLGRTAQ